MENVREGWRRLEKENGGRLPGTVGEYWRMLENVRECYKTWDVLRRLEKFGEYLKRWWILENEGEG